MHIQLYSVKGFTGDALRDKLSRALTEQHIEHEIIEINSVAQFVRDGIPSVPAIQIGRKVFLHNPHATLEETVDRVMDYILKGQTPSILVPVDFSEESLHAVEFAAVVAEGLELDLTLTHIHVPIYDPVSGGACDVLLHQDQQAELHDLAARMTKENKERGHAMRVDVHLESGEPAANLIQLSALDQFEMIVMATKGKGSFLRNFFGTISARVGRHSLKPVMIIPPNCTIAFPKNWVIGFDQAFLESNSVEKLLQYHDRLKIGFSFMHVLNAKKGLDEKLIRQFKDRLNLHPNGQAKLDCNIVDAAGNAVESLLFQKIEEEKGDLLVLFSQDRTFMESIQHSSVIRKVIMQANIPVLIIPLIKKVTA